MQQRNAVVMSDKGAIYSIMCKVNGKRYVGQTKHSIEKRWKEHINDSKKNNTNSELYKDLNRYGIGMFVIRELERVPVTLLNEKEKHWISEFDTFHNGYNQTTGGASQYQLTDEAKSKIVEINSGVPKTQTHCNSISQTHKQNAFMLGVVNNPNGSRGKSEYKVRGTHKQTGEIIEFNSLKDAAEHLGIKYNNISNALNNKNGRKSAGGYTWEKTCATKRKHPIYGRRILDGKEFWFDSIRDAAKVLNSDANKSAGLRKALKNPSRYSWKGCRWYHQKK